MRYVFTFLILLLWTPFAASADLNVVASIPDFGDIAKAVGGRHVKVTNLARGTEDPHFVDPRPSFIAILNRADVLIEGGADLERGWLPPLVKNARNPAILPGGKGRVVASSGIRLIEVPSRLDRSMGDVHPKGNPHFWLDPINAKYIARNIAIVFSWLDPANAGVYRANLGAFYKRIDAWIPQWNRLLAPYRGSKVVSYHSTFNYFLRRFGIVQFDTIEPKPGIEPSAAHISDLIERANAAGVKVVLTEPNRPRKTPTRIAQQTGAKLVLAPGMTGGVPGADSYIKTIDNLVRQLASGLSSP